MRSDERIRNLEALVIKHQDLYYNDQPEISDAEFDAYWDELTLLDPENQVLRRIGEDNLDGFPKAEHLIPMGSQEKAADPESFLAWAAKIKHPEYLVQFKLDGASLELQYREGRFFKAVTRGNGLVGDDITANARTMHGVVMQTDSGFSGGVRGEVVMSHDVLALKFSDKANCRNAANGLMKRKDGIGTEFLDVVVYDAVHSVQDDYFRTESEKIAWLRKNGFQVVESKNCPDANSVVAYRAHIMDIRPSLPFDIDGLVIKGETIDREDMKRARPERQIAFKFSLEEAVSTLLDVEWSESGASYTPVGIIEPVKLAGTTVKRASLANSGIVRALGLMIGSRIAVTKRGEIIPKIECLVENPPEATPIPFPETCGTCGSRLEDDGIRLFCPNGECPKLRFHRLEKWIQVIDAMDFGPVILKKLFDSGRVRDISDLYTLTASELESFDRMGTTLARKLIANLERVRELQLSRFIAGYDIDGIGERIADRFVRAGYRDLESLAAAAPGDLSKIDGIGDITATNVLSGLSRHLPDMKKLLGSGKMALAAAPEAGPFTGKSFCFTGELSSMKRPEAERRVKSLGGSAKSAVSSDLTYLVTNDPGSGSSKNKKAQSLGVAIIDERQFLELLEASS